jgi:hypothetical protein
VSTAQTTSGGAFTAVVQPLKNTLYTVKVRNTTSPDAAVGVRPRLRLRKLAPHRYSVRTFAAVSFAGKYAAFQRYNGVLGRWIYIRRILLRANATGVAPTVISSVSFRSAIRPRLRVRVVLPQLQVGSCYRPGRSRTSGPTTLPLTPRLEPLRVHVVPTHPGRDRRLERSVARVAVERLLRRRDPERERAPDDAVPGVKASSASVCRCRSAFPS